MQSFHPPKRTLMGPGPSDVPRRVLQALARPTIGHLDPAFVGMMDEVKIMLRQAFCTDNALTFPISAPGSAGMECCFANLVEPDDEVIICINGVFGGRMKENVERMGGIAHVVEDAWGTPVDPNKVRAAFVQHPKAKILAFVHAETSTGVRSDAKTLCAIAREFGALSLVDAVTSLGGIELQVDAWGIDAIYSGSQKCLSCPPGLSPVSFSKRAAEVIASRTHKVRSWFLDLSLVMAYWQGDGARTYHHTAPVNAMVGLHEGLIMLHEEGLQNAWVRHGLMHEHLKAGLENLGLRFVVEEQYRLPQLNAVQFPASVQDEAKVRRHLLEQHNLEIGAGLGALAGKVWRIGLMGASACEENIEICLSALEASIKQCGQTTAID
ncbi:MAG: alanine--glyoxylate aminotransferase family protein [Robiginitomaculum sp.]|nr:alanine--glyoxylate aminotransferase family protein [Robiginitomaculum sp.]